MAKSRKRRKPPPLSVREIRFCQMWVDTDNATRSYIDAGFPHASDNAAAQGAKYLLRKPQIQAYVEQLVGEACDTAQITVNRTAQGLARTAFGDRTAVFGEAGEMLPPREWPKELKAIVAGVEVDNIEEWQGEGRDREMVIVGRRWKVKFERSLEALKVLAQWQKMVGQDKAEPPPAGNKNALVVEVELGPDHVQPPAGG